MNPPDTSHQPFLCAVFPELPEFMKPIAEAITKEEVRVELAGGFISAIASDIRSEIIGDNLGIPIPVDVAVQAISPGRKLLIGVFMQTLPQANWDGIHRGEVTWYRVYAPSQLHYEPPL